MIRIASCSFLALVLPAAAQVALQPGSPRVHDTIEILVDGAVIGQEWASGSGPEVSMAGNRITVTLPLTGGNGIPANLDWALGAFPAGSYQVDVVKRSTAGTLAPVASASFAVAARTGSAMPHTNYSDLWFNPNESGWGINIQQHPSDKIFATWFVYGLDNKPTWFVIPDGTWTSDRQYTGTVYRTHGPFFQDPVWNPSLVSVIPAGSATLQFTKYDTLVLSYTIDGVPGQKTAVRQGF
ncbi:MAG TPA: hypothetical protein VFP44_18735 [Usitatibacter sp.]|nr:hypothetical protein [Usitatibacter sp.]